MPVLSCLSKNTSADKPLSTRGKVPRIFIFILTVTAVGVLVFSIPAPATGFHTELRPQDYQPLDPLTPAEIELATQVANADGRVKEALGRGKQLLVQVQFLALKSATESPDPERLRIGRNAEVLFYRYDGDQGLHVVVDLEKKAVVSVTKLEGRAVPLGANEVTEAFNLALRNERVKALLGSNEFKVPNLTAGERPENRVEGLRVVATSPRDSCYKHRCIDLLFHTSEGYLAGTSVTVDLTAQTVRAERTIR